MRQHYLFCVAGDDPAPAGGGDTKSWIEYYKLNPGAEETFIPFPSPDALDAKEGDYLWFIIDRVVTACVQVTRVGVDAMNNDRPEIWYDARNVRRISSDLEVEGSSRKTQLEGEVLLALIDS